jgi:hypothetical protein
MTTEKTLRLHHDSLHHRMYQVTLNITRREFSEAVLGASRDKACVNGKVSCYYMSSSLQDEISLLEPRRVTQCLTQFSFKTASKAMRLSMRNFSVPGFEEEKKFTPLGHPSRNSRSANPLNGLDFCCSWTLLNHVTTWT